MLISRNIYNFAYGNTKIRYLHMENVITYKKVEPNKSYEVWVSKLFGNTGEYRVNVIEECDSHISQTVDVNLRWYRDKRWLENYIKSLKERTHIKMVVFGNGGCMNDVHYPLEKYKELFGQWKGMDFLNDLNIAA